MRTRERLDVGSAVLWASAFVILAMIIVQAGGVEGRAAFAEMASARGAYTLLTTDAGRGGGGVDDMPNEILYVLDSRDEVLLVYEVEDARRGQVLLRSGGSVAGLFRSARP